MEALDGVCQLIHTATGISLFFSQIKESNWQLMITDGVNKCYLLTIPPQDFEKHVFLFFSF